MKDLTKILKSPKNHFNEKYLVKGYITGFYDTNPENIIKKIKVDGMKILDLKAKEKVKTRYRTLYHIILMMRDDTMKKNDHINVYITTEFGDQHLFETWKLLPNSND